MGQFAPVMPLNVARQLKKHNAMGKYHLLLAHDVLAHPAEYADVYGHLINDPETTIILDNSLVELGQAMDYFDMLEAAKIVNPSYVVAPDVLENCAATLKASVDFLDRWQARSVTPLMGVVQGKNIEDIWRCAHAFGFGYRFGAIAIPRVAVARFGSRSRLVTDAIARRPSFSGKIHLLGFSGDLLDDIACTRIPGVMGIDSAVPVRAALQDRQMSLDQGGNHGPRGDYWEVLEPVVAQHIEGIKCNIADIRHWAAPNVFGS